MLVLKRAFLSADRNDPVNGLSLASGQWSLSIQCKYSTENLPVDFFFENCEIHIILAITTYVVDEH